MKRIDPGAERFSGAGGSTGINPADSRCFLSQEWAAAQPGETFLPGWMRGTPELAGPLRTEGRARQGTVPAPGLVPAGRNRSLDFEVPEGVRLRTVGVGAVDGNHSGVDGCPVPAKLSGIYAGCVTGPQDDSPAFTLDVELAFHNEVRFRMRVEVLPAAGLQFPFRKYEVLPSAYWIRVDKPAAQSRPFVLHDLHGLR
jgi:hypothetical protein